MSGHSKWSQIKRTKGVLDQKKGLVFSKYSKKISIAVKEGGGGNPDQNFKLKSVVDSAKAAGMPNDNIERAIKNALGEGAAAVKEVVYEGYGPFGTAFLVEAATDNSNRTFNNIRKHIFRAWRQHWRAGKCGLAICHQRTNFGGTRLKKYRILKWRP